MSSKFIKIYAYLALTSYVASYVASYVVKHAEGTEKKKELQDKSHRSG
jgi:hypothetical protein